jgi:F0F1-type ATP synthase assembly protein I
MYFWMKVLVSGLVIAGSGELAKRSAWLGAMLVSLPLMSILSLIWLQRETGDARQAAAFAQGILWAIVPSIVFFVIFPALLKAGWKFAPAMVTTCAVMVAAYGGYSWLLARLGVRI